MIYNIAKIIDFIAIVLSLPAFLLIEFAALISPKYKQELMYKKVYGEDYY